MVANKMADNQPAEMDFPTGVLEDTRPAEEKAKDFMGVELFGAVTPPLYLPWENWKVSPENVKMLATFPIQNQDGSYSCLSQSGVLALAINNFIEEKQYKRMSPRSIYPRRRNAPSTGMWADDLGNLCINNGVIFESVLPSDGQNEGMMNDLSDFIPSFAAVAKIYRAKNYVWLTPTKIDEVANVLSQGKPVVLTLQFDSGEWAKEVPTLLNQNSNALNGHAITALPGAFFTYTSGAGVKKAVLIQDSWGISSGMNGRRILTEDWFTQGRVKAAMYFVDLQNLTTINPTQTKPNYHFAFNLSLGAQGNDVAMLQRCLGYINDDNGYLFPLDTPPTGFYGGITRAAVKRFQAFYVLPVTGNVDDQTREKLNEIFAQ
jgi:peptidoglycan hydrolase-like protein with peptidoglycan-binding domain